MNIKGIDKAVVLAALYNRARAMGLGMMHYDPTPMTLEGARKIIKDMRGDDHQQMFGPMAHGGNSLCFDYLKGRCMKVDLSKDEVDVSRFDREYGEGAAQRAVDAAVAAAKKK